MLRADFTSMGEGRTPGRHLSEITRAMQAASGLSVGAIPGEQANLRPQIGFLWERALEGAWREYHLETRPVAAQVKVVYDDVEGTPDGLHLLDLCTEEYKFTWKTMRKWDEDPEQHFPDWMARAKGYLYMVNKGEVWDGPTRLQIPNQGIFLARFLVFWCNGDYSRKEGRGPQVTEDVFRFEEQELEDHWKTIKRYDDWLTKRGE